MDEGKIAVDKLTEANASRLTTNIDFATPGKQHGYLSVPDSNDLSAYGRIQIPVVCIRGRPGPTVLMLGGNHGDEYEGQVTLSRLALELNAGDVNGRLIILPAANLPAAAAGTRTSPIDGGNLNRSFPGDRNGGPTAMIAHYVESVLLPMADVAIDLHSGGRSLEYLPCSIIRDFGSPSHVAKTFALAQAFAAPHCIISYGGSQGAERTFHSAADRAGTVVLTAELGGAARITPDILAFAEAGVRRVLHRTGIISVTPQAAAQPMRLFKSAGGRSFVLSPERGVFEPKVRLGEQVEEGELAGYMHDVETPLRAATPVFFSTTGTVICVRSMSKTQRGDCLYEVIEPVDMPALEDGELCWAE